MAHVVVLGLAEIDLPDITLGITLGVLGVDIETDTVGGPFRLSPIYIPEESFIILVNIPFFSVPFAQLVRFVTHNDVANLRRKISGSLSSSPFGARVPNIRQDRCIQPFRKPVAGSTT
jgi:hypothetical protein